MDSYPAIPINAKLDDLVKSASFIQRLREQDISDFSNLSQKFIAGRKVGKIPSSSADIADDDRIGDINYDDSYLYIVVDNSGAEWRRISLGSW